MYEYNWYVICGAVPPRACRQHPLYVSATPDPQHRIDEAGIEAVRAEQAGNRRLHAELKREIKYLKEVETPYWWNDWLDWVESLPKYKNASCYD